MHALTNNKEQSVISSHNLWFSFASTEVPLPKLYLLFGFIIKWQNLKA